jgi:hypothetical protein
MDQILDRGLEQAEAIMADFPSEVQRPSLADYEALVTPWKSAWDLLQAMRPRDDPSTAIDAKPPIGARRTRCTTQRWTNSSASGDTSRRAWTSGT